MKNKILIFLAIWLAGILIPAIAQTPEAKLLDVKFKDGGEAIDVSQSAFDIQKGVGDAPTIIYDEVIKQVVSLFKRTGSTTTTFFKVDYENNEAFKTALGQPFTLEVYTKTTGDANMCSVSGQESGGFGIEQGGGGGATQLWYNQNPSGNTKVGTKSVYSATDPQYYHIVFAYDGTQLKAYYNGVFDNAVNAGTVRFSSNTDAHWIGIGGDSFRANEANYAQYAFDGNIAVVRMYDKALSDTEITSLYGEINARKALTKVDELYTYINNKLPQYIQEVRSPERKTKAEAFLQRGWSLMHSFTTTDQDIIDYLADIATQLNNLIIPPKFAVISDVHVGNGHGWATKIPKALNILKTQDLDAIFVAGDITDWGTKVQWDNAKKIFADNLPSTLPVYYCMGNHDWYDNKEECGTRFKDTFGQDMNQYVIVRDHPFILISMENSSYSGTYKEGTRAFLSEKLAHAAANYPGKPIFLFMHMPVKGTVQSSALWGTNDVKDICDKYPQIIAFSGHSHYPLGDERSIDQSKFTSIDDGSVTYSEIDPGLSEGINPTNYSDVTEGCVVSVEYNNDVTVKRLDFTRDEEIKQPWVIKAPHDGTMFTYTKDRTGGTAPVFKDTDELAVSDIKTSSCTISFPQATDDDVVYSYKVSIKDGEGNEIIGAPAYNIFSQFYLNSAMPTSLTWAINGLKMGRDYIVSVVAVDAFGLESAPLLSSKFTTTKHEIDPSVVAPKADLLDVKYNNDTVVDISVMKHFVGQGPGTAPTVTYDASIKQYISSFKRPSTSRTDTYFKVDYKDNEAFKTALREPFTLEVYTKTKGSQEMSSVSSMENGGFGIEQVSGGGASRFWFGVDAGGYKQVGDISTYNSLTPYYTHIVYTYDGNTLKSYYNGAPAHELVVGAGVRLSSDNAAHWIGIGADAHSSTSAQGAFNGDIALVRMYNKEVSLDEVIRLYEQIENRSELTLVEDLNTVLITTLSEANIKKADKEVQVILKALAKEGWDLMNSLATTDPDIEVFLEKVKANSDATIHSLKIDGEEWDIDEVYEVSCNGPRLLPIEIETAESASVNLGHSFDVDLLSGPSQQIKIIVTAKNKTTAEYTLNIRRELYFDEIVIQKWNKLFIVNSNPANNGGYNFVSYSWFKDGASIGRNSYYYSAGSKTTDVLDTNANYQVELTTSDGKVLKTCPGTPIEKNISVKAYPNPVYAGETLTLDTELPESDKIDVSLYNMSGTRVFSTVVSGQLNPIQMPSSPGAYILHLKAGEVKESITVIVK